MPQQENDERLPHWQEWLAAFAIYGALYGLVKLVYWANGITDFTF